MKRPTRIILLVIGISIFAYMFLSQLGILILYNNPTTANEPNLKLGSKMLVSNLVKPKMGDFVCFKFNGEELDLGVFIKVNRLCGLENDTVLIENGVVYLNNLNFDKNLSLIHNYKVSISIFENLEKEGLINESSTSGRISDELYLVSLEDSIANRFNLISNRIIENKGDKGKFVKEVFNKNWNKDNFGPLIIPKGKIFVIGDNRDNSLDSRSIGLIDKDKIVGVVVKKF